MKKIIFLYAFTLLYVTPYCRQTMNDAQYKECMKCFDNKDYPRALTWFEKAIKANPNNGAAYYMHGMTCMQLQQAKLAIADFENPLHYITSGSCPLFV